MKTKLNLGCGKQVVDGWLNVDYALGARLAKVPVAGALVRASGLFNVKWDPRIVIHNLATPFPWGDGSVDVVYTSHTLEHFTRDAGARFLRDCVRVLKPGGVLRIVVPDLHPIVARYVSGELQSEYFLDDLHVLCSTYASGVKTRLAPLVQYPHKCMYDSAGLLRACAAAGMEVKVRNAFDSEIEDIREIEIESRTVDAVIVEGRK